MSLSELVRQSLAAPIPDRGGRGQGVIMVGGGRYLPSCYLALRHLRNHGCGLPVQLWYLGQSELPHFFEKLAASLDVELVDATKAPDAALFQKLSGWSCKALAILGSRFEQALLLDADNIPLVDPSWIFASEPFVRYGQIFWPDFYYKPGHQYAIRPAAWSELGLPPRVGAELEGGQVAVDRNACARELQIVQVLNAHAAQCYGKLTWGDKDTFTLAWMVTGKEYYSVPIRPRFIEPEAASVFWQYWTDGRRIFQHQRKWFAPPEVIAGQLLDDELLKDQSLEYLREFCSTAQSAGTPWPFNAQTSTSGTTGDTSARAHLPRNPDEARREGILAFQRGEAEAAVKHLERAVAASPSRPDYRVDLAALLSKADRPADAIPHLLAALRLKGEMPEIHNNLGVVLEQLERNLEAAAAFRNAIRFRPDYAEAHHNLGKALRKCGDPQRAIASYRRALEVRPDSIAAREGLTSAAEELGDASLAILTLRDLIRLRPTTAPLRSWLLYTLHYDPDMLPAQLYEEHREWDRLFGVQPIDSLSFDADPSPDRRLRIGYLSPDFRHHTVPRFIGAALANHDRARFQVFCYGDVAEPDEMTDQICDQVERWRDIVGLPDERVARIISDDQIDILVDLRGHAAGNRMTLFARRAAPLQINMVGYFDTTGLSAMDYRLTDERQDPPGQSEQFHTERLLRVPGGCWCYTAHDDDPPSPTPPARKNGFVTFGSLNKIIKVSEPCSRLWAQVLQAVPGSRLMLSVESPEAAEAVAERLERQGLPRDRLDLLGKTGSRSEYLDRFAQIDIALDTFPFNGITTTCDGLWMAVPHISLSGRMTVSRAGRSILHAVGLGQLATDDQASFIRAAALADDLDSLEALRRSMRDRMRSSPLMDHIGFTRALESQYRCIWRAWCDAKREQHTSNNAKPDHRAHG